jgi:hypothetical protein
VGTGVIVVVASGRMSFFSSHLFLADDHKKLSLFLNFFHSIMKVFVTLSMKGWGTPEPNNFSYSLAKCR